MDGAPKATLGRKRTRTGQWFCPVLAIDNADNGVRDWAALPTLSISTSAPA
ncbi:MAG: hypothetical protein QOI78_1658 [Actinomycetota bacterium]|nr:hypothetical protein [Actinomycetota bacterium]